MKEGLSTRQLTQRLLILVVAMFAFGFALVPIYDVMCQAFGVNGKTAGVYTGVQTVDEQRQVRVPSALSQICVGVPRVARTSVSSRRALGGGVLAQAPSRAQRMTRRGRVRRFMSAIQPTCASMLINCFFIPVSFS